MTTTNTANYPDVTTRAAGTVQLGTQTYQVEEILYSTYVDRISGAERPASSEWNLIGRRGARYLVRPFLTPSATGVHEVISLGSGAPLRVRGNVVRVIVVGDIISAA